MAYSSRGRTMVEVILAAIFVGFLTGFVAVLCIGNYFRAKRAMERQRQRRLAQLAAGHSIDSPRSNYSSSGASSTNGGEQQMLLTRQELFDQPRKRGEGDHLIFNENSRPTMNLIRV